MSARIWRTGAGLVSEMSLETVQETRNRSALRVALGWTWGSRRKKEEDEDDDAIKTKTEQKEDHDQNRTKRG